MARTSAGVLAQWLIYFLLQTAAAPEPQKTGHSGIALPEFLLLAVIAAVLVALLAVTVLLVKKAGASGKKPCPYCAEPIQAQAQICRFCNRPVTYGNKPM